MWDDYRKEIEDQEKVNKTVDTLAKKLVSQNKVKIIKNTKDDEKIGLVIETNDLSIPEVVWNSWLANKIAELLSIEDWTAPTFSYRREYNNLTIVIFTYHEDEVDKKVNKYINNEYSAEEVRKKSIYSECFIATASYNDINHPNVLLLRQFRDESLMNSKIGKNFISFYYSVSPKIADWLKNKSTIKLIVRKIIDIIVISIKAMKMKK